MTLLSFLNRTKPIYISLASLTFITLSILVNLFPVEPGISAILNASFQLLASTLVALFLLLTYSVSQKNNFAFSRTLLWLGFTATAWAIGDAIFLYLTCIHVDPFITATDFFYVAATLLLMVTVLTIPGSQPPSHRLNMVFIEISILILSATVLFAVTLLMRGKPDLNFDLLTLLMVFIYPVLDIILIWIIIILYFAYPFKSNQKVLGFFFTGGVFIFLSDVYYLFTSLYEPLIKDYLIDWCYYVFYAMLLLAGLSGFKEIREPEQATDKKINAFKSGTWIIFMPGVFLIVLIGLLMLFVLTQSIVLTNVIIVLIAMIIFLFILHQYLVIGENIKLTKEMRQINVELENIVEERTAELSKANIELQAEMKEREKAEDHLARSNQDLALLNRDKDKLFSILAHDLRGPLGSMMNLSLLLAENINDFDEKELLEIIGTLNKSATQTYQLFNDLLAWSAVQMGRGEREKKIFTIAEVFSETRVLLASDAERKQIIIHIDVDKALVAYADKFAIQTIMRNLVSNAIKFSWPQSTVTLKAEKYNDQIKISVIDKGIGITMEKQKKIFRVDAVSSTPGTDGERGTGFGLLLCKDLVERNGGKIWLESEKGKGSNIMFSLPVDDTYSIHNEVSSVFPASRIQTIYDHSKKITFTSLIGEINTSLFRSELIKLWRSSDYPPDYSILVDLQEATLIIDTNDLPAILELFSAMPGNNKNRKFALLTATPQQVAYSTMFGQNIKNKFPFIVEVFSTYDAAMAWLGV